MSIATEQISNFSASKYKAIQQDVRNMAKEHGAKVRRNPISGIDVTFADGRKKRYIGWFAARKALIEGFDLAD